MSQEIASPRIVAKRSVAGRLKREFTRNWQLYLVILVPLVFLIVFNYLPMFGIQIAFKDFSIRRGIWGSDWVGFKHFEKFFNGYSFLRVLRNTVTVSLYSLIAGFPMPILLALGLNVCLSGKFKKTVQMVTYAPHFISTVVMVGIINQFFAARYGIVNLVIKALGGEEFSFLSDPNIFSSLYVWSGVWQGAGWGSIIYISTLSAIDPTLHEAAIVDGATRWKRVLHIDIPGIRQTMVIMLILNFGSIMNVGFEKAFLMQNSVNLERAEVISTYLFKIGLQAQIPDYSLGTAVGLFNSIINFGMVMLVNWIAKRVGDASLW